MKYVLAVAPFVGLIAVHDAWTSFECPLMLGIAMLVCITIKSKGKSNEQGKKKES